MTSTQPYTDDDIVYVDPETKTVVGPVNFSQNGAPQSLAYNPAIIPVPEEVKKTKNFPPWRKTFPFGTYRSMKRVYKVEGKMKDPEPQKTLEEVLPKALSEAYWSW